MKTTLIADNHHLIQKGLRIMLNEVLGSENDVEFASNGKEVLAKLSHTHFHMLITDLDMPETNSLEMVTSALKTCPDLKILVVTIAPDAIFAPRYLRAGIKGYVSKDASDEILREAIWTVSNGKRYMSSNQAKDFAESFLFGNKTNPFDKLSKREFEVLLLLLKGGGAIEVANALSIATSTASTYRARIFEKLGIKHFFDLLRLAGEFHVGD